jgi:hypothetical protein
MVNIIENKAKIKGTIKCIEKTSTPQGYCELQVKLEESDDVEGYPNLAKADEGSVILINLHSEEIAMRNLKEGESFHAIVKKVFGQKYFVDSFSK